MTDALVPTPQNNGPMTPDQIEQNVRARIAEIDREIASVREQKAALSARTKELTAEKDRWERMLPRKPRTRKPKGDQLTIV